MAEPVRARRLSDEEGQRLLQIVRRGKHESVRVRRAMIIMASASGHVTSACPDRCFAFGQFGPLSVRPCHGACRARREHPVRLRATYHRTPRTRRSAAGPPRA